MANNVNNKLIKLRKIMTKKSYDEASVIRSLSRKAEIRINSANRVVEVMKDATDVGNGSWGKIDYLTKVHGYVCCFVNSIKKKSVINQDNDSFVSSNKTAKREGKLNMAAMAKSAMRKAKTK